MPECKRDLATKDKNLSFRKVGGCLKDTELLATSHALLTEVIAEADTAQSIGVHPLTSRRVGQSLLRLQRQYGNHYVQREVSLAEQGRDANEIPPAIEEIIQTARSSGQALDSSVRAQMESLLDADFSSVRVHTDAQADALNRSLNARAFTTGQDVFFKQGEHNPGSASGRELLAHELIHVVQQDSRHVQPRLVLGQPDDLYEREAILTARVVTQQQEWLAKSARTDARQISKQSEEGAIQRIEADIWVQRQGKTRELKKPSEIDDELLKKRCSAESGKIQVGGMFGIQVERGQLLPDKHEQRRLIVHVDAVFGGITFVTNNKGYEQSSRDFEDDVWAGFITKKVAESTKSILKLIEIEWAFFKGVISAASLGGFLIIHGVDVVGWILENKDEIPKKIKAIGLLLSARRILKEFAPSLYDVLFWYVVKSCLIVFQSPSRRKMLLKF